MSGMALPDYMVTMRKDGINEQPIAGKFDAYYGSEAGPKEALISQTGIRTTKNIPGDDWYSVAVWQRYAECVWMDINQSDVLTHKTARGEKDERHISPLQLTPIRRCIQLWTNPGDTVFSPFAGIGSELYVALELGRKAVGAELKKSYYDQAVKNIESLNKEGIAIDENALEEALKNQVSYFYDVGKLYAETVSKRDAAKQDLAEAQYEADTRIRHDFDVEGRKIREAEEKDMMKQYGSTRGKTEKRKGFVYKERDANTAIVALFVPPPRKRKKLENKEEAKELSARERLVCWVIDRNGDDAERPMALSMSWTMDRDIAAQCHNKKTGKVLLIDHPDDGFDVLLKKSGQGLKTKYYGVSIDRESSPINDDEKVQDEILEFIENNPIPSILVYKDSDYLERVINGEKVEDAEDEGEDRG
ncbi:unnamed protein product [Sphagnum balticum]